MVHSVELLLDPAGDAAVRAQWDRLAAAGLPSQARHRSPTNRPHVTLLAGSLVDASHDPLAEPAASPLAEPPAEPPADPGLASALHVLPLPVRLGAPMCFGRGPFVLVRLVVATPALLRLQADVVASCGRHHVLGRGFDPGAWVPHVTLARRLPSAAAGRALELVAADGDLDVALVAARRWDGAQRREWRLPPDRPP